jgi:hypothetical protein
MAERLADLLTPHLRRIASSNHALHRSVRDNLRRIG